MVTELIEVGAGAGAGAADVEFAVKAVLLPPSPPPQAERAAVISPDKIGLKNRIAFPSWHMSKRNLQFECHENLATMRHKTFWRGEGASDCQGVRLFAATGGLQSRS